MTSNPPPIIYNKVVCDMSSSATKVSFTTVDDAYLLVNGNNNEQPVEFIPVPQPTRQEKQVDQLIEGITALQLGDNIETVIESPPATMSHKKVIQLTKAYVKELSQEVDERKKYSKSYVKELLQKIETILDTQVDAPISRKTLSTQKGEPQANEYILNTQNKLRRDIESLRGDIKKTQEAIEKSSKHDLKKIEAEVKGFKDTYTTILESMEELQKPVHRKIDDLNEKIKSGKFVELAPTSIQTLEILRLNSRQNVLKKQDLQNEIQTKRESLVKDLEQGWIMMKDRLDDLRKRLNWLIYCEKCLKEGKGLPSNVWYYVSGYKPEFAELTIA